MGIIGDAFRKLFGVLWDVIKWIGKLLYKLFEPIIDFLKMIVDVLFAIVDAILYFLYQVGVILVKFFVLIFETMKVLWSLVVGFARTLGSLHYSPSGSSGNGYSSYIGKIFGMLGEFQLNSVATILLFAIWFTTAVAAMKYISSTRVGGD